MWGMRPLVLALLALPHVALADCPAEPDRSDERAALHTELLASPDPASAQAVADKLWTIWLTAPDDHAQTLLNDGMARRSSWDLEASERILDELVAYCPDYAEGYNQRAFTRFMRERLDESLADIDSTLRRNPYHFGALSGRVLVLMRQGRAQLAQTALREALKVHPHLQERRFLVEDGDKDI